MHALQSSDHDCSGQNKSERNDRLALHQPNAAADCKIRGSMWTWSSDEVEVRSKSFSWANHEAGLFSETIKSVSFHTDVIKLPRCGRCTLGNLLCCVMELMRWQTCRICAVLPKHACLGRSPTLALLQTAGLVPQTVCSLTLESLQHIQELCEQSATHHKRSNLYLHVSIESGHTGRTCGPVLQGPPPTRPLIYIAV